MSATSKRRDLAIAWGTGLGLVAINLLVGWVVVASLPGGGRETGAAAGEVFGRGFLVAIGCAVVAIFAGPSARKLFSVMVVVSLLATCVAGFLAFQMGERAAHREMQAFTDAERRPPESVTEGGEEVLVHRALGFEIDAPPGLSRIPDDAPIDRALASAPAVAATMAMWRWASPSGGSQLVVVASAATSSTEPDVQRHAFARTVDSGLHRLTELHLDVLEDRHVSDVERVVRAVSPTSGAVFMMRSIGYAHDGRFLVVVASGTTLGTTDLDATVESLHASP